MEMFICMFLGCCIGSLMCVGLAFLVGGIAEQHFRQLSRELNKRLAEKARKREMEQVTRMKELMGVWDPEIAWDMDDPLPYAEALPVDPPMSCMGKILHAVKSWATQ